MNRGLFIFINSVIITVGILLIGINCRHAVKKEKIGNKQQENGAVIPAAPAFEELSGKEFSKKDISPVVMSPYPEWELEHVDSNYREIELKKGKHKGKKRRYTEIYMPGRTIVYEATIDPEREGMPLLKRTWGDIYFKVSDLNIFYFANLYINRPIEGKPRNRQNAFSDYGLKGGGHGKLGSDECAALVWNSGKYDDFGKNNEVIMKFVPLQDGWFAMELDFSGVKLRNKKDSLELGFGCYPFQPSNDLRRAMSTADNEYEFTKAQRFVKKPVDDNFYWIMFHNLGSKQKYGMVYLFAPEDFKEIQGSGGYGCGVNAFMNEGKTRVRCAFKSFRGIYWKSILPEIKKETPVILKKLSEIKWRDRFLPPSKDIALAERIKQFCKYCPPADKDKKKIKEFLALCLNKKGIASNELGEYFSLRNELNTWTDKAVNAYISKNYDIPQKK
jgi:hypothetical protein